MTFYRRGICVECAPQTELHACVRVYRKDLCVSLILSHLFGLFKNCLFRWMYLCSPLPANIHLICIFRIFRLQHFLPKHFCFSPLLFFSHWEDSFSVFFRFFSSSGIATYINLCCQENILHFRVWFWFWNWWIVSRYHISISLSLSFCVCVDSNSSKRICKVMHICNIGSSSTSSIDSFSNIFQVHWKNLQRSFSIYTTSKFVCLFYIALEKIYGIFMVNTWRNMLEFVASSREHDVGSGGGEGKKARTTECTQIWLPRWTVHWQICGWGDHAHHGKCKRKINVQKNSANFRLLAIYRLADASSFPPQFHSIPWSSKVKSHSPHQKQQIN